MSMYLLGRTGMSLVLLSEAFIPRGRHDSGSEGAEIYTHFEVQITHAHTHIHFTFNPFRFSVTLLLRKYKFKICLFNTAVISKLGQVHL